MDRLGSRMSGEFVTHCTKPAGPALQARRIIVYRPAQAAGS
jgi:hypothetical protein